MSWITGVGLTSFGRREGASTLSLMSEASDAALADAQLEPADIDGLLCGYSTTMPHIMLSNVFAEHYGLVPEFAESVQLGGATGGALVATAHHVVAAGAARNVLVVAGENRLTGQSRESSMRALADVGHPRYEVPLGPTVPAYYALLASSYLHETGASRHDLAALAVLMRRNASRHDGAHLRTPITLDEVLTSKPIATPLTLLDCCPISDGGAALVISAEPVSPHSVRVLGTGQSHGRQHVSAPGPLLDSGAGTAAHRALDRAGVALDDVGFLAVYDSFTITLAMLLEEVGAAPAGRAGALAADGHFDADGRWPLNTHGGLLSHGHSGVAGGMAHIIEAQLQLTGRAGTRQAGEPGLAYVHTDGGVLSSHVALVLEGSR